MFVIAIRFCHGTYNGIILLLQNKNLALSALTYVAMSTALLPMGSGATVDSWFFDRVPDQWFQTCCGRSTCKMAMTLSHRFLSVSARKTLYLLVGCK
jgi:hypothetical protein